MSLVGCPPFYVPAPPRYSGLVSATGSGLFLLDADGEKGAIIFQAPKTGEIKYVHWKTFTVTTGGDITVGLKTVSDSDGNPTTTDKDASCAPATVAIGSGDDGISFRTDLTVGGTQSTCTVTKGDLIAVVFARPDSGSTFDGYVSTYRAGLGTGVDLFPYTNTYTGGAWGSKLPCTHINLALEYDDGSCPVTPLFQAVETVSGIAVNNTDTPDIYALKVTFPFACRVRGAWAYGDFDGGCDIAIVNSSGTVQSSCTVSVDPDIRGNTGQRTGFWEFPANLEVSAGTTLYLIVKPTSGSDITVYVQFVDTDLAGDNRLMDALDGLGDSAIASTCVDGTWSWTDYNYGRLLAGFIIDQIAAGASVPIFVRRGWQR